MPHDLNKIRDRAWERAKQLNVVEHARTAWRDVEAQILASYPERIPVAQRATVAEQVRAARVAMLQAFADGHSISESAEAALATWKVHAA